jgi:hypothetical protein
LKFEPDAEIGQKGAFFKGLRLSINNFLMHLNAYYGKIITKISCIQNIFNNNLSCFSRVILRKMISSHKELAHKLSELEQRLEGHDEQIQIIFEAINQLMEPPKKPRKKIGF